MYDWIDQYKRANGLNQESFSWDMIPFEIMKTYAAMDAVWGAVIGEEVMSRNNDLWQGRPTISNRGGAALPHKDRTIRT